MRWPFGRRKPRVIVKKVTRKRRSKAQIEADNIKARQKEIEGLETTFQLNKLRKQIEKQMQGLDTDDDGFAKLFAELDKLDKLERRVGRGGPAERDRLVDFADTQGGAAVLAILAQAAGPSLQELLAKMQGTPKEGPTDAKPQSRPVITEIPRYVPPPSRELPVGEAEIPQGESDELKPVPLEGEISEESHRLITQFDGKSIEESATILLEACNQDPNVAKGMNLLLGAHEDQLPGLVSLLPRLSPGTEGFAQWLAVNSSWLALVLDNIRDRIMANQAQESEAEPEPVNKANTRTKKRMGF